VSLEWIDEREVDEESVELAGACAVLILDGVEVISAAKSPEEFARGINRIKHTLPRRLECWCDVGGPIRREYSPGSAKRSCWWSGSWIRRQDPDESQLDWLPHWRMRGRDGSSL
jgi:hypothetical protein